MEPKNSRYVFRKGQCQVQLKKWDDAISSFETAAQYNPGFTYAYLMLYKIYYKEKKDMNNAVKYLKMAYENESDQQKKIKYKVMISKFYLNQNDLNKAMAELRDAKAISPNDITILEQEGNIYAQQGNYEQALDSYSRALEKASSLDARLQAKYKVGVAYAHYRLGNKDKYQKIYDELNSAPATRRYAKLLKYKIGGALPKKELYLAKSYLSVGEYEEAEKYAEKAIGKDPSISMSHKMMAYINVKRGNNNAALSSFAKAAEVEKDEAKRAKIYSNMVKLQFRQQQYGAAIATADKILQKDPNNVAVLYTKAQSEYHDRKYGACVSSLEKVVSKIRTSESNKAKYYFLMGLAAEKSGDRTKAQDAFNKAAASRAFKYAATVESKSLGAN